MERKFDGVPRAAHQSLVGRTWTEGFLSSYRLVYTVGSVVTLKKTHMVVSHDENISWYLSPHILYMNCKLFALNKLHSRFLPTTGFFVTVLLTLGLIVTLGLILCLVIGLTTALRVGFTGLTTGFNVGLVFGAGLRVGLALMPGLKGGLMILGLGVGLVPGLVPGLGAGFFTGALGVGLAGLVFAGGLAAGFTVGLRGGGFRGIFTTGFLAGFGVGLGWRPGLGLGVVLMGFFALGGIEVVWGL